jgi:hypothetical protein
MTKFVSLLLRVVQELYRENKMSNELISNLYKFIELLSNT